MATYFLTGVAGFVGSRTAKFLLQEGHTVVGVDNLNDYYDVRLKDHRLDCLLGGDGERHGPSKFESAFQGKAESEGDFHFLHLDIEDGHAVGEVFKRWHFDAVINLAARAGVRYSVEHPEIYATTNLSGSIHLLQGMVNQGTPKYVLASTSSLYAGSPPPFVETANVTRPISPYAATKLAAEAMAHTYHHLHGIDVSILRYFTVYGPAGRPDMSPYRFAKWIDEGVPITLYGDGTQSRDFTYIDDIAQGTVAALRPVGFEVINLGGGNSPISINEMISQFEQLLGKKAIIDRQPFHEGDMKSTHADITKAGQMLDWAPQIKPADGFSRTMDWYVANRNWLRGIEV